MSPVSAAGGCLGVGDAEEEELDGSDRPAVEATIFFCQAPKCRDIKDWRTCSLPGSPQSRNRERGTARVIS
jgi:hypothetical protein